MRRIWCSVSSGAWGRVVGIRFPTVESVPVSVPSPCGYRSGAGTLISGSPLVMIRVPIPALGLRAAQLCTARARRAIAARLRRVIDAASNGSQGPFGVGRVAQARFSPRLMR